jgi:hypothetical protein
MHDWRSGGSARSTDAAGRLYVTGHKLSRVAVNEYLVREIPNSQALGLDPSRAYPLFRSPVELAKAAPSFSRLPIMRRHIPVSAAAPQSTLIVGCVGSDVRFAMPFLVGSICLWDQVSIAGVESEEVADSLLLTHMSVTWTHPAHLVKSNTRQPCGGWREIIFASCLTVALVVNAA